MESQPQNPEFRNSRENFHPCNTVHLKSRMGIVKLKSDVDACE